MANDSGMRDCPYCKEEIKSKAIKCKHCGSSIAPAVPEHGGTCPYCKETIHKDAIKCKHCKTMLNTRVEGGCGCGEIAPIFEQVQISNVNIPVQNATIEASSQLGSIHGHNNFIFCWQRCIEWSKLFPNVCNRWVWDCSFGPIIIIWGSSQFAAK